MNNSHKQVLIPLIDLASGGADSFLELRAEPAPRQHQDYFQALQHGPLKPAVALARQALSTLPPVDFKGSIYLAGGVVALSSSKGAALALALCPWLMQPHCPYPRSIVMGLLGFESQAGQGIQILPGDFTPEKMQAILNLGYQIEPTLLLMPKPVLTAKTRQFFKALAKQNIAVLTPLTLAAACQSLRQA